MNKLGGGGLIVFGIALFAMGLVLRMDLIDWLISAVGALFLLAGAGVGIAGIIKLLTGRKTASV
jgi:hypothetical protein